MTRVSVAVVGPHGCGKTTALAQICVELNAFVEKELADVKQLAKALGRPDSGTSWVLDRLTSERERGMTVECSFRAFESPGGQYVGIDVPGHPSFVKSLLGMTPLADIAMLTVSAALGEWEDQLQSLRIREIALTCFTMGIKHVLVLVTKMDHESVDFSVTRFEDIKKTVLAILKEVGYKTKAEVVPVSGRGENIARQSQEMLWYEGKTLIETLDALAGVTRPADKPLRLPVVKVYSVSGGTVISGRVETGSLSTGHKLALAPSGHTAEVESIEGAEDSDEAKAGEIVSVRISGSFGRGEIKRGMVASRSTDPVACAETFKAQVVLLDHPSKIRPGYCPLIAIHTTQVLCEFEVLLHKIDRKTGKESEANPEFVTGNDVFMARLRPRAQVCVESFATYPSLGRFAILEGGRTVGVGVVKEVVKRPIRKIRNRESGDSDDDE